MKRHTLHIAIVLVALAAAPDTPYLHAQEPSQADLAPIPYDAWKFGIGETICKPYFMLSPPGSGGAPGARSITYGYKMPIAGMAGYGIVLASKFEVIVDDRKKVPTAQVFNGSDQDKMLIVLRISEADYRAAAACLPKPKTP